MIDRNWIGHELPVTELTIDRQRLRFFAKAIGETSPVYVDVDAARAAGYADLPAPPTFLVSADLDSNGLETLLGLLKVPIARLLHAEQGFTYHATPCAGDVIAMHSIIADVYDKKQGALEFIVKTSRAVNRDGALVAELRTVLVVRN